MKTVERMSPTFTKYHLGGGRVRHHFTGPDIDGPHDHPWGFKSEIVLGGYVEEIFTVARDGTWSVETVHRTPGATHNVLATHIHRIVALPMGACVTVVTPGPLEREARFWRFDRNGVASRAWWEPDFGPVQNQSG